MKNRNHNFLFMDEESGEEFFVQICANECIDYDDALEQAMRIARENFDAPEYQNADYSDAYAESIGLDTY